MSAMAVVALLAQLEAAQLSPGAPEMTENAPSVTTPAQAPQEKAAPPEKPPAPQLSVGLGYARERLLDVDFGRLDMIAQLRVPLRRSPVGLSMQAHLMPGRSTEGLTSYRSEFALGGYVGEGFRAAAHLHANYTMVLRATERDAFMQAVFGNIGAFGVGPDVELALGPFEGGPKLFPTARAGVDWFPGSGAAVWAGGALHLQFY